MTAMQLSIELPYMRYTLIHPYNYQPLYLVQQQNFTDSPHLDDCARIPDLI